MGERPTFAKDKAARMVNALFTIYLHREWPLPKRKAAILEGLDPETVPRLEDLSASHKIKSLDRAIKVFLRSNPPDGLRRFVTAVVLRSWRGDSDRQHLESLVEGMIDPLDLPGSARKGKGPRRGDKKGAKAGGSALLDDLLTIATEGPPPTDPGHTELPNIRFTKAVERLTDRPLGDYGVKLKIKNPPPNPPPDAGRSKPKKSAR